MPLSKGVTGWRGIMSIDATEGGTQYIRFTDESINVPQGIKTAEDVHVGQRSPGVYEYELITPDGTVGFPLITDSHVLGQPVIPVCAYLMKKAISPYQDPLDNTNTPCLTTANGFMKIYRGDCRKDIKEPWCGQVEVSGEAGGRIAASLTIRAIVGDIANDNTIPGGSGLAAPIRTIMFNELNWASLATNGVVMYGTADQNIYPRRFSVSCNNNLVDDNSYNPTDPQSLAGFAYGIQGITAELTLIGAAYPNRGGTQATDPLSGSVDFGGIYIINNGVWSAKTITVPGVAEISVSNLTLAGMAAGNYGILPGAVLGGA
jgi:hypothetical protein